MASTNPINRCICAAAACYHGGSQSGASRIPLAVIHMDDLSCALVRPADSGVEPLVQLEGGAALLPELSRVLAAAAGVSPAQAEAACFTGEGLSDFNLHVSDACSFGDPQEPCVTLSGVTLDYAALTELFSSVMTPRLQALLPQVRSLMQHPEAGGARLLLCGALSGVKLLTIILQQAWANGSFFDPALGHQDFLIVSEPQNLVAGGEAMYASGALHLEERSAHSLALRLMDALGATQEHPLAQPGQSADEIAALPAVGPFFVAPTSRLHLSIDGLPRHLALPEGFCPQSGMAVTCRAALDHGLILRLQNAAQPSQEVTLPIPVA